MKSQFIAVQILVFALVGCLPEESKVESEPPIRGLITKTVREFEETTVRRYPGVLEPGEVNVLAFEVGGRLGRVDLDIGEQVVEGQLLMELDVKQFETEIANREAVVREVRATLAQSQADLERSQTLLDKGVATVSTRDEDRTRVAQNQAQLTQALQSLESAKEDLADAKLFAPFDGIVDSLEVQSFATVSAGQTVLTVYQQADYEISFSVSFDVVGRLVVGTPATIRLADDPSRELAAVVSELGERAEQVSSFPVVVQLLDRSPLIKAGMAVEVTLEFPLRETRGHLIPISAAVPDGDIPENTTPETPVDLDVFVFNESTSAVVRRRVTMAGIRGNQFVIVDGLALGDRVAIKGVAFLKDGMIVRPIDSEDQD